MDTKATATLHDGSKVSGRLTTDHSASSYGQPVFVDDDGQAYNWADIADISTAAALGRKGGRATSEAKTEANRAKANLPPGPGKNPRGWPKGKPRKPKSE
jgi:hypothetical protein